MTMELSAFVPSAPIRVQMFGPFTLLVDNRPLPLPPPNALQLLAFLLLYRQTPHSRTVLVGRLWPDYHEVKARRTLSQALWQIRRILPDKEMIQADGATVGVHPDAAIWLDVDQFEQLLTAARRSRYGGPSTTTTLRQALQLYTGDLLPGMYAEWVLEAREQLRQRHQQALTDLLRFEKQAGNYRQALDAALTLTRIDPLDEEHHREVMRIHLMLHHPWAARQQYEICRRVLAEELGVAPAEATRQLVHTALTHALADGPPAEAISVAASTPDAPISDDLPFVGRSEERRQLLRCALDLFQERGGAVCVAGKAGIGKTRLLRELAEDARWHGIRILWGHSHELEATLPFGPLGDALQCGLTPLLATQLTQALAPVWLEVLSQTMPQLQQVLPDTPPPALQPAQEIARVGEALCQVLETWSRLAPLMLILDDLQWADADSLALLPQLIGRLQTSRVLLVLSYRPIEAETDAQIQTHLHAISEVGLRSRVVLEALDPVSVRQIIRFSLGDHQPVGPAFVGQLCHITAGNPLFILETLRSLHEQGTLAELNSQGTERDLELPATVEAVLQRRFSFLVPQHQTVLHVAAVLGKQVEYAALQAVSELDHSALLSALGQIGRWGFLSQAGDTYEFRHDAVRHVAYAAAEAAERMHFHRCAACWFEANRPDQIAVIAYHFRQGHNWAKAIPATLAAARRARANLAYREAIELFTIALDLLERYPPFSAAETDRLCFEILEAREMCARMVGRPPDQRTHDLARMQMLAERLGEPAMLARALCMQAFVMQTRTGYDAPLLELTQKALHLAEAHSLAYEVFQSLQILGHHAYQEKRWRDAIALYEQCDMVLQTLLSQEADAATTRELVHEAASVLEKIGLCYTGQRLFHEANAIGLRLLEQARAVDNPYARIIGNRLLGFIAMEQGDPPKAIAHYTQSRVDAANAGFSQGMSTVLTNIGFAYLYLAIPDFKHAYAALQQSLLERRRHELPFAQISSHTNLGEVLMAIGRYDQACEHFRAGLALTETIQRPRWRVLLLLGMGRLALEAADRCGLEPAMSYLSTAQELMHIPAGAAQNEPLLYYSFGMVYFHQQAFTQARSWLQQALDTACATNNQHIVAHCHALLAQLDCADGNRSAALAHAQAAVDVATRYPLGDSPLHAYYSQWCVSQAAGRYAEACASLSRAYELLQAHKANLPDPSWEQDFLEQVPLNRMIMRAYQALQAELAAGRITLRLPALDAPLRGPLPQNQLVPVTWTASHPSDGDLPEGPERRQRRLLRLLEEASDQGAIPRIEDLMHALGAGRNTIKRDLALLRQNGHAVITRGTRQFS